MTLSGFEITVGGITSIPLTSSLALPLYKAFGEKQLDTTKLKANKVAAKVMQSSPKKEKVGEKTPDSQTSK